MSARARVLLSVVLLVLAAVVCAAGEPLSGTTLLALVLGFVGLDVLVPVLIPPAPPQVLLEEAVELIEAERRAQRTAASR